MDDGPWRSREKRLLTAAEAKKADPGSFAVSPDGRHWAYAVEKFGGRVYVIDGVQQQTPYRRVVGARFSDDGKDFAFVGLVSERKNITPEKYAVVLNGKPFAIPPVRHYDVSPSAGTILAVGGGRVAYTGWEEKSAQGPWTLEVMADGARVSKSSAYRQDFKIERHRLAATAVGGKLRLVTTTADGVSIDGKLAYRTADHVKQLLFSADGSAWAAVVETTGGTKAEAYVVVNGEEKKRFDAIAGLVLTPDGKQFGYLAELSKAKFVVVGAKATAADWGQESVLTLAPDGSAWAVAGAAPVGNVAPAWPKQDWVSFRAGPVASPDARSFAAVVSLVERKGDQFTTRQAFFRDGKELFDAAGFDGAPVWSPDGKSLVVVTTAADGKSPRVVRDGKARPAFDEVLKRADGKTPILEFSPDGRSLAYAVRDNLVTKVVIDGTPRGAYDQVGYGGTRVGFTPEGRVTYLARKADGSVWWVEELPPGDKDAEVKPPSAPAAAAWQSLFDGTDLSKWGRPDREGWKVEGRLLVARGKALSSIDSAGDLFGDFQARVVARTTRGCDSYVVVRGAWVRINNTLEQGRTGSIYPSADRRFPPHSTSREGLTAETARDDEWFTLDILVSGDKIATRVNGKRLALADLPSDTPKTGAIGLAYRGLQTIEVHRVEVRDGTTPEEVADEGKPAVSEQGPARVRPALPAYKLEAGFEPLFDGKSLAGWNATERDRVWSGVWKVKDGLLRYEGRGPARLATKTEYTDFHLRLVARTTEGNRFKLYGRFANPDGPGVLLSEYGYLVELVTNDKGDTVRGGLQRAAGGGGKTMKSFTPELKAGEWFTLDFVVRGKSLTVRVNGEEVAAASDNPKLTPALKRFHKELLRGRVALQAAGADAPFEIYRLDIKKLK